MEQRSWFIIESGTQMTGPFTLEEVRERFSLLPKRSILICDGQEPIYSNDVERFNEIVEKGFGRWKSFTSRSSVQGIAGDPFAEAHHFSVCSSADLNVSVERFVTGTTAAKSGWIRRVWKKLFSRGTGPRRRRWLRVRKRHLALFGLIAWGYYQIRPLEERITLSWLRQRFGTVRMAAKRLPVESVGRDSVAVQSIWRSDSPLTHTVEGYLEEQEGRASERSSDSTDEGQ